MSERVNRLKKDLLQTRDYTNAVLDQVDDRWDTLVYSDGLKWSVRQLLHHLADADRGHNNQVMGIAQGRNIIPEDFDVERYNASITRKTAEKTVEESRASLEKSRQELLDWLNTLDETTLDKKGRHASLRIMSIENIVLFMAKHEQDHVNDIANTLEINV